MRIGSSAATRAALLVASLAFAAAPSRAATFTLEVFQGGVLQGTPLTPGDFSYFAGPGTNENYTNPNITRGQLQMDITLDLDPDPELGSTFIVTNTAGGSGSQHFTLLLTMSVAPIVVSTLTSGSADGGVSDQTSGDGATLSTFSPNAFYTALIDGLFYDGLIPDGNVATAGSFSNAQFPHDEFGLPGPSQLGPTVATSIGMQWDFNLTNGDVADFSGIFIVKPVPEPSTAVLLVIGLALVARGARRR